MPDIIAIKEDSHSSISPINEVVCDPMIDANIAIDIASIWVAVLHLDKNSVRKLRPENSVASRIPEMTISRHNIIAAGMIELFETI